jgi:cytochrome P450
MAALIEPRLTGQNKTAFFPSLAEAGSFLRDPLAYLAGAALQGDFVERKLAHRRFLFLFQPEAAHAVLVKRASIYRPSRSVFDRIRPITGKRGLVQLQGPESAAGRAKSRGMFQEDALASARKVVASYVGELEREVALQPHLDPAQAMTGLILKTAMRIFLGLDSPELVDSLGKRFLRLNELCGKRMLKPFPLPLHFPTSENFEILRLRKDVRCRIEQSLHSRPVAGSGVPAHFGGDPDLVDHCLTFLFAGHETTAASLAFALLLLSRHPEEQDRIAVEGEAAAVRAYKESLRLYPPAYMLAREALVEDEVAGIRVQAGDQLVIGLSPMHRSASHYESPGDFRPARFSEKLKNPLAFLPFGAGPKSCVGERLAYLEAGIVLARLCRKFRFSGAGPIRAKALVTLHPAPGQFVKFVAR